MGIATFRFEEDVRIATCIRSVAGLQFKRCAKLPTVGEERSGGKSARLGQHLLRELRSPFNSIHGESLGHTVN